MLHVAAAVASVAVLCVGLAITGLALASDWQRALAALAVGSGRFPN
jgi:hypothetical protein